MQNQPKDSPGVIAFPPLILLISVAIGVGIHFLHPIPLSPRIPLRIIGGLCVAIAVLVSLLARAQMVKAGTNVNPGLPATAIVAGGPYRFTRNPMYLSMCLLNLGIGLLICDAAPCLMTLALAAVLNWGVIVREERYLERKFGTGYSDYRRGVRRWV